MKLVENRAAAAVNKIKSRRFSYRAISEWLMENRGIKAGKTHIYRIGTAERYANAETEKALIEAARVMK